MEPQGLSGELQSVKHSLKKLSRELFARIDYSGEQGGIVEMQWRKIAEKVRCNCEIIERLETIVKSANPSFGEIDDHLKDLIHNDFLISLRLKSIQCHGSSIPPELRSYWRESLLVAFHSLRFAQSFMRS